MNINEFLNTKWTLKSVISIIVIISVLSMSAVAYIYASNNFSFRLLPTIDSSLQSSIDAMVSNNSNIVGIQVVKVDLSRNIRFIEYTSVRDGEPKRIYNTFVTNRISREVPVLTGKEIQDSKIISLINHEFICYPFKETISYEFVPELAKHVTTVCSTTIPPYSGKFSGFIAVFLKDEPDQTQKDIVRIESIKISNEAYNYIK